MERHDVRRAAHRERAPAAEAVVGVDDVEAVAAIAAGERGGRSGISGGAGVEGEQLELEPVDPAQSVDLIPHEPAPRRGLGRGPQVRDDEHPHGAPA